MQGAGHSLHRTLPYARGDSWEARSDEAPNTNYKLLEVQMFMINEYIKHLHIVQTLFQKYFVGLIVKFFIRPDMLQDVMNPNVQFVYELK